MSHVFYTCCATSRELRGLMEWSIPRIPSSRLVAHVFYTCAFRMVIRRVTCSIQDEHVMSCDVATFCHTCAFHITNMRGKDTLHSNRGCLRLDAIHAAAWRMDTVSISERYCMWMLPWHAGTEGSFLQVHNNASLGAKWAPSSSWLVIIGRDD
jgi:hypothetical protein